MTSVQTRKHASKYICEKCNFKCSKQSDFDRHLLTAKHVKLTNTSLGLTQNVNKIVCNCGKHIVIDKAYTTTKRNVRSMNP